MKLIASLLAVMIVIFALLGYLNVRLHRQHLEAATLASAERVSDVISRSITYYMVHNDRDGLYHAIQALAAGPGIVKIRIFDQEGRVDHSTDPNEINRTLDKNAEACYGCHTQTRLLSRLNRPDRFRIYRSGGQRVLGIITPIENRPDCSNAECHAHPASQKVLGVLDTNLSLAKTDAQLASSSIYMVGYTAGALLIISFMSWLFVWRVVDEPIKALKRGTKQLSMGDLGYQIHVRSDDEAGDLALSFNSMSLRLQNANEQLADWTKTLEHRVAQKTIELKSAHDHMLHVEKMASLGKMAAVVAHEVNNPLCGILTYAKLLRKWVGTGQVEREKRDEAIECLDLIATESRRCGDLIKNLLSLSRTSTMNVQSTDLNAVVERCLMLVRHRLELGLIELQLKLATNLPPIACDPAQIEQVLLALVINAIDAMPQGGTLWLENRLGENEIQITVRDNGSGIAADVLPHIFEPFMTTKETGQGVGLGLAITLGIVERHGGRIDVASELGRGTTFTISLPVQAQELSSAVLENGNAAVNMR
jgi:two-component system, NtrC family, sensor kinase